MSLLPEPRRAYDRKRIHVTKRMPPADVVRDLVVILGARLTAVIGGVSDTQQVLAWETFDQFPERIDAFRAALEAA